MHKIIQSNVQLHHPSRDPSTHRGVITKIYVEIHVCLHLYMFLLIGIVRNCDQLEVTGLTCFLIVIPERSRGDNSNERRGIFVRQERRRGYAPRSESSMCKPPIRQGRWLVAHHLKLPAVDG